MSAISLSLAGIAPYFHWTGTVIVVLLGLGVIFAIGSIVLNHTVHRPSFLAMDRENKRLVVKLSESEQQNDNRVGNLVDVVNVLLRDVATDVDIYKGDTRLSVYRHSGDKFYLVGRVSPNEGYAVVGRTSYPDTQGFIGQVWRAADDKTTVTFPVERENWLDTQVESYGFERSEADALKMHTVVMTATKLRRDRHGEAFGVLCIECDKKRATIKAETINQVKKSQRFESLTSILDISLTGLTHEEVRRGFLDKSNTSICEPSDISTGSHFRR